MSAPTHARTMNYENLSITIQANGKSVESLLAKLVHVDERGGYKYEGAMGGEAPHTDAMMKEL